MPRITLEQVNAKAREHGLDKRSLHYDNLLTQGQYKLCYDRTQGILASGEHVLDWGCGNGHYSFFLDLIGAKVTGFSLFEPPQLVGHTRNFSFTQGSPDEPVKLPFETDKFDAVFNIGVLQLVHTSGGVDQASLHEIFRVVRPGGYFVTTHLPNEHGWIERLSRALRVHENFHLFKYTRHQIDEMWTQAGFELIDIKRYNFLPRNQLRKLPRFLLTSRFFVSFYNALDALLEALFPRWYQNWYVLSRKPGN